MRRGRAGSGPCTTRYLPETAGPQGTQGFAPCDALSPVPGRVIPRLFAVLVGAVKRLGEALQREDVGRVGALCRHPLDHRIPSAPHGLDQMRFLGGVLDPSSVLLRVERE